MDEWNIGDSEWWGDGFTMPENNGRHEVGGKRNLPTYCLGFAG